MIWFGRNPALHIPPTTRGRVPVREWDRMRAALELVATRAPHLSGAALLDSLESTGWIDRPSAARLLPLFRNFDADRHFAEHLRRLSFRGVSATDEFRAGIARVLEDIFGAAEDREVGGEPAFRFVHGEREGLVLAYPEVNLSIGGPVRAAIAASVEEMPDALVIIARSFQHGTPEQFRSMLAGTEVPGTMVTVNLLLGLRATALRYQPPTDRIVGLLGTGRPVRSTDLARLVDG